MPWFDRGFTRRLRASRALFWAAGALVLFTYGYVVNAPPWDFGRLLGIYVVFFFVVAQVNLVGGVRPAAGPLRHRRRILRDPRRPRHVGRLTLTRRAPARVRRSGRAGPSR